MADNNLATKSDLNLLENRIGKKIDQKIEEFAGQIISATGKGFEELNNKIDSVKIELNNKIDSAETELKREIRYLKDDVNNLKADSPSKIEFQNHEKRISRLEKTTFPNPS